VSRLTFISRIGLMTVSLAYMLDSLVRVTRRDDYRGYPVTLPGLDAPPYENDPPGLHVDPESHPPT